MSTKTPLFHLAAVFISIASRRIAAVLFFVAAALVGGIAHSAEPVADADLAEGKIHRGVLDGLPIRFTIVKGNAISEGDILLGPARAVVERVRRESPDGAFPANSSALKSQTKGNTYGGANRLWPRNAQGIVEVPYVITLDPQNRVPDAIIAANNQIGTFLKWVPRTTQNDYVSFNLSEDENFGSCFSSIGRIGGMQNIGGSKICGTGTLVHEMGHAVGLYHEQQRGDRNTWHTLDRDNVDPLYLGNFDALTNQRDLGGYDYGSIMHYSAYSFVKAYKPAINTVPAGIPIGTRERYSQGDVEAIRRLYGFTEQTTTIDTFPANQRVRVDGVLTTTPATFNWPIGSTHTLEVPSGVDNVNGTLLTFARWSNDRAASLNPRQSITITAGDGTFGQPANAPAISTYTAHFSQVVEVKSSSNVPGGVANLSPAPETIAGAPGAYYRANSPLRAVATAPAGYQFALWGPSSGLFHFPTASNRSSNPFAGPVSVGSNYVLADWIANFTDAALARVKAEHAGGEFAGAIVTRVDGSNNADQNLPATSYLWANGEAREFQAKAIVRGLTGNVRYKFVAWEGGPTSTAPDRIIVTKPVGGINSNTNYTARYVKQFKAITELDNASGTCGSVALDRAGPDEGFYNFGESLTARYTPPTGMVITSWNGNFAGSGNQATFVINDIPYAAPEINTVNEPLRVTSLSKNQFTFNTPIEFDITGSGFTAASEVYVANVRRAAVLVGANVLRVTIPASDTPDVGKGTLYVANRAGACAALAFSSVDIKAGTVGNTPNTGWWWNKAESGRGFFVERRGSTLFMAGYLYEPDGRPSWFIASGPITGNVFTGRATTSKNGQTLEGTYVPAQVAADLGPVTLTFTDASNATMSWPGGTTPLTSFVFGGGGPGTGTSLGESGWWWNETESGRGYSIEMQGSTLFMVAFMYDASGNPVWYLSSGTMQSPIRYSGRLLTVRGGQTLTGPYQAPTGNTDIGSISFDFNTADRATMTLPSGKVVALTRFRF
jgi:Astacin (Peptidase family M12A)